MHAARMLNEVLFGVIREQTRGEMYWRNNIKIYVEGQNKRFLVLKREK
jgi:hypothetical protein